jgi:tetratricopeptide (TPR) repeat protein
LGLFGPADVAATRVLDEAGAIEFAAGAPLITDDRNLLAMRSPRISRAGSKADFRAALAPYDPLIRPQLERELDRAYIVRRLLALGFNQRALHVGNAARDPVEQDVAVGLVHKARGDATRAARHLRRALNLDPTSLDARMGLLQIYQPLLLAGSDELERLAAPLPDPAAAVVDGWRREAARDWAALEALDGRLVANPHDPAFADAIRLRVRWRLEAADPALARQALAILDPMLATSGNVQDLLLRAEACVTAQQHRGALVTLFEVAQLLGSRTVPHEVPARALAILRKLPRDPVLDWQRGRLVAELRQALAKARARG